MYLVYLTSQLDRSSVNQWLYVTGKSDAFFIEEVDALLDEVLAYAYDIIVFDYNMNVELIDALRSIEGKYESIQVFVANSKIGEAYLTITENISVIPKALNLMVYLWQHPAFTLGNILNAEEVHKEVFSVSDFAEIDTEKDVLEFKTTIEDLGDSDLAEVELLKVEKQTMVADEDEYEATDSLDIFDELGFESQTLKGLIKRDKIAPIVDAALEEMITTIETDTETENNTDTETETENNTDTETENNTEAETETENNTETDTETENNTDIETEEPVENTKSKNCMKEQSDEEVRKPVVEKVETIYEDYSEENKDKYDEVVIAEKAITENTTIEAEYENDMTKMLHDNNNETGVIGKSDLGETAIKYHVKSEDLRFYEEEQQKIMQELAERQDDTTVDETPVMKQPRVLKGLQTYVEPTRTITRHVGIKTVEAPRKEITNVKKGTLASLRKRSMRTYRNPYEYFRDKHYSIDNLDEIYDYVQTENLKGNNILFEDELYNRGCIDDDIYINFMKEFLHRQVLNLEDLMRADVILNTWDEEDCRKLRLLEISSHQNNSKCVVISNKATSIQNSLLTQYEKLELYVTLDHYIDMRLNNQEGNL